jgi:predicted transposase YdaD
MTKIWDSYLKRLIEHDPQSFLNWLLPGATYIQELPTHENRGIDIDTLHEARIRGKRVLFHLEIQRYEDRQMAQRLLEYNVYAMGKHHCPVLSFVLYLRKEGRVVEPPLRSRHPDGLTLLYFQFWNVKLWEIPTEALRAVGDTGLLPLLVLTREGRRPDVLLEALAGIEESSEEPQTKKNLITTAFTLASLALRKPGQQKWLKERFLMQRHILHDTLIYQLIMEEGEEKGIEQGKQEGLQVGLQQQKEQDLLLCQQTAVEIVQARFPDLAELAGQRICAVDDLARLNLLIKQLALGASFSSTQARRLLEELPIAEGQV